ncbi:hypothetical protein NDU88_002876 [Pleurodeles waltl]|uniref:Uncharacterized protein n=1 Tax=Pleurodeles waltl TaxID=8319 RepID=A0AAV7UWW4_PLEWA|nr:hypothetical protein NDU88_002876 [Pleurodeles waltl]
MLPGLTRQCLRSWPFRLAPIPRRGNKGSQKAQTQRGGERRRMLGADFYRRHPKSHPDEPWTPRDRGDPLGYQRFSRGKQDRSKKPLWSQSEKTTTDPGKPILRTHHASGEAWPRQVRDRGRAGLGRTGGRM